MTSKNDLSPLRPLPQFAPVLTGQTGTSARSSFVNEVQLREYWKIVLKHRTIIFAFVLLSILLGVLIAFTATPLYTANAKIRISTYEPVLAATKVEGILQEKSKESNYLETQIQEIKSFSLADRVLRSDPIRGAFDETESGGVLSWIFGSFGSTEEVPAAIDDISGYKHPIALLKRYLDAIGVSPVRRTSLVVVSATARDPRMAALIANKHSLEYIDWIRLRWVEQQSDSLEFLKQQADELRRRVADLENELAQYAEDNSIIAVNKDENITAQRMAQLNNLLSETTAKRIEADNQFQQAQASLSGASAGFDDPSTQTMRAELAKYEAEYAQLSTKFTADYPRMQQLKGQISGLKQSIQEQRKQIVAGLESKAKSAAAEEVRLNEELEHQKSEAFELAKREVQYNILQRELASSRELLDNVLRQVKETALAVEGKSSSVSLVDYAVIPTSASFPRKGLVIVLALVAGIAGGVGLAFLFQYLDNTLTTPEQAIQVLSLPNLGVVPSFELEEGRVEEKRGPEPERGNRFGDPGANGMHKATLADDKNLPVVYARDPKSLASEAYRTIRTAILLSQAGEPPRTILVSSAQSSEGKTTSTLNLAACLASAGGHVVLIDADLRRPSLHRYFEGLPSVPGLVEVITGQAPLQTALVSDVLRRVTVLPAGNLPPNPAELLGSVEMASIIDRLTAEFDYVLIDSPPVLPVTDAVILSRYVDGVVLVVKGASTPKRVALDAKMRLEAVGARLLGTILNDVDVTSGEYYYYNRYYHSYYQERPEEERESVG